MKKLLILFVLVLVLPFVFAAPDIYEPDNNHTNSSNIPTDGTWQTHTFDPEHDMDYINFSATAGAYYLIKTVNLTAADITHAQLFIADTDGVTPLSADSSGWEGSDWSAKIVWRANNTAFYYIMVNESNGTAGGSYNLSVLQLGTISPYLVYPSSWMNATKYQMFNFTAGVTCVGGPCYDVQAILDPRRDRVSKAGVDSEVSAALDSEDEIAVIVKLKDDSLDALSVESVMDAKKPKKGRAAFIQQREELTVERRDELKAELRQRRKDTIAETQDSVLDSMDVADMADVRRGRVSAASGSDFKLKHKYSTINAFAGTVTRKGLEKLMNDPNVEYVSLDREVHAALLNSVPWIDAKYDAWNIQVGGTNITGAGQTVCVIDTGIAYSHNDFGGLAGFPNAKVVGGYDFVNDDANPADDHYHGTHCSGIVASQDPTYTGVAPGAKLVSIKALDAGGSGTYSDIAAGIDWCVDNSSSLNISVISMSLGSWYVYDNNGFGCDDFEPVMTEAINNAVANDIFVAVASGNRFDAGDVGVAVPACIKNATSVGRTDSSDNIDVSGQRSLVLDLLAPGTNIFATYYLGGHAGSSGTSMSTPHVAGLAALIQQYFRLRYNRTLHPQEIEWLMKFNGVNLYDAVTGLTFARIDADNAVLAKGAVSTTVGALPFYTTTPNPHDSSCLDSMAAGESCNVSWIVNATGEAGNYTFFTIFETDYMSNITDKLNITIQNFAPTLTSPSLNYPIGNTTTVFNFSVNYTDADNTTPVFMLTVLNGTDYPMLEADASDMTYSDGKMYYYQTTLVEGNYTYRFNASDGVNMTNTSLVYAPNVSDNAAPLLNLSSPADNANVSSALQLFSFNVSDESAPSVNCSLTFDGIMVNYTIITGSTSGVLSYTIPAEGTYLWNISCDDSQNTNNSATRTINYDATSPIVTLVSPANGTVLVSNVSDFTFNATDNLFQTLSCNLYVAGVSRASNSSVANGTNTNFNSVSLTAGSLAWLVNCTDSASNTVNSSSRTVIVPQQNATAETNTTANIPFNVSATAKVSINLTTSQDVNGTVTFTQYNTNPETVAASSTNGFAALGISTFVSINASAEIEGNLSWYLLNIYYDDSELPSNIDESTLRVYYYNSTSGQWEQEVIGGVDTTANRVWANITHFSVFSAGGSAQAGGGSGGGGGGGGGGGATASSNPIGVVPTYSVSLVEAPKNQQISVSYEGIPYLFKVTEFTGSVLTIRSLPDFVTYTVGNGLTSSVDLDNDGRFDIQIGYSGSYGGKAMVLFYLVQRPEPIALLPPAPRTPREEPEPVVEDVAVEEAAPPAPVVTAAATSIEKPREEPSFDFNLFYEENRLLFYYLGGVALLIVAAFLVVQIVAPKKPESKR